MFSCYFYCLNHTLFFPKIKGPLPKNWALAFMEDAGWLVFRPINHSLRVFRRDHGATPPENGLRPLHHDSGRVFRRNERDLRLGIADRRLLYHGLLPCRPELLHVFEIDAPCRGIVPYGIEIKSDNREPGIVVVDENSIVLVAESQPRMSLTLPDLRRRFVVCLDILPGNNGPNDHPENQCHHRQNNYCDRSHDLPLAKRAFP